MRSFKAKWSAGVLLALFALPEAAHAQQAAPITVTPPELTPGRRDSGFKVEIPEAGSLTPPIGAEGLSVTLGDVEISGGFPELAHATGAIVDRLKGHPVTLAEIYSSASAIEAAYAQAGYILVRVSVPPQDLKDGGPLRIVLTDGFIEAVDVSGVPERVRSKVMARAGQLQERRHLRLRDIEGPLLVADELPGLALRSTLVRGGQPGGARLVLEGAYQSVSGQIGVDNTLHPRLGTYGVHAEVSLNSLLGLGEQIYGFVATGYDITQLFSKDVKVRVLGGGLVLPIGDGRFSVNPEATLSRTRPDTELAAPQIVGLLRRLTLRGSYTLVDTRRQRAGMSLTVEQIDEFNKVPAFAVMLSHDRYMVARLGASWLKRRDDGGSIGASAQLSRGLGDLGSISLAEAAVSGVPYSRQGTDTSFTRLAASAHGRWPIGSQFDLAVIASGETAFGKPVFRSEQFVLEGPTGLSAYTGGQTAIDEGGVARVELGAHFASSHDAEALTLRPYIFAAIGAGRIAAPTLLETGSITAGSAGVGLRSTLGQGGLSLDLEYAHGFSDYAPLDNADRVNVALNFRF